MKCINKRNGKVTANVTFDEKCKTYLVEFTDGTNTVITSSTFKRWYKVLEAPETVETLASLDEAEPTETGVQYYTEDEALENAVVDPDDAYCADGTTYSEIGKEIAEQAKAKAKKVSKERKTKEIASWVIEAQEFIRKLVEGQGDVVFVPNGDR